MTLLAVITGLRTNNLMGLGAPLTIEVALASKMTLAQIAEAQKLRDEADLSW
jgi:hypothetical protein